MQKNISLLGSTGSIGRNVLKIVQQFPGRFRIIGLAAGKNISLLKDQVEAFQPQLVSVASDELAHKLAQSLPTVWKDKIVVGREGNERVATLKDADTVLSAILLGADLKPAALIFTVHRGGVGHPDRLFINWLGSIASSAHQCDCDKDHDK